MTTQPTQSPRPALSFELPDGSTRRVEVVQVLNAGYAGRSQEDVAAHVAELAELGVPAPSVTPALYPISPYLAQQTGRVSVQHGRTSGEAEWALVVAEGGELLLTAACDHTDRELEVHGVAWSKNAGPDVLAARAWRLADVDARLDDLTLRAWVSHDGTETEVQSGTLAELLPPAYWVEVLRERGDLVPGTVLISGTIPMTEGVDQFADRWRVELGDPATGDVIECSYDVVPMPEPIG
ncbi:conserved hypothetical protein [Streptomyces himastatinicus ATCC 53653]|uniref:DUF2848 domain-containing protein n=1 Tax=Streptomyces himastatinicus ATCC 53653 TaxID=457427 RepID=D9W7C5_9ACTN|nr:DUF2848 domain-containing protein [Streptomyces himastatinicus]EFL26736.1 conserved hypothetical protein [Streptomyces himastatinicus ATCC 53653]